ncbi:hypothetical protein BDA96_03G089500 [Sorghum bicolor]|uniref:Uncharacterized protein n=2 Tax=Sorghum bicolor TaxID=4558 RepID=A0A921RA91_SORBI|nr:hypothetical protein BDA96_03G089500 [Sorghum bicolor]OQU86402.1 hypothetical protein SORBI_3003G085533 [Sorghum bicolor]
MSYPFPYPRAASFPKPSTQTGENLILHNTSHSHPNIPLSKCHLDSIHLLPHTVPAGHSVEPIDSEDKQ